MRYHQEKVACAATKIKVLVFGYPPRKRKPCMRWLDTDLPEAVSDSNARGLAVHWLMYKQKELGWRDSQVKAFGEFRIEKRDSGELGTMVFEDCLPMRQWEIKQ